MKRRNSTLASRSDGHLSPSGNFHTTEDANGPTGITAYLTNGGTLEHAQTMAVHESPRTMKLYDRTRDRLTREEVERIRF